ncbi:MAG: hypothetical protein WC220_12390 [Pedobacter sp.]|jgi:hypothetical protein
MRGVTIILFLIFISSCTNLEEKPEKAKYLDIKGFFEAEIERLSHQKALVNKSVRQNEVYEVKTGLTVDWNNELSLFIASDINKPAWRDSYTIRENDNSVSYLAIDTSLRTRSVLIKKGHNGRPVYFRIKNITLNNLYESSEELTYVPDSVYSIDKNQKVRFMGKNSYQIRGIVVK